MNAEGCLGILRILTVVSIPNCVVNKYILIRNDPFELF